ncbi:hypothetical protein HOLleu_02437 [Holothuria leucospilota]|uniref:CCHC-type domain-containing protein n=1 Tax=Holothuria leucospilota TaxID=206669 RepID=A0A9Q1CQP8_HOLLE|nr:hypothetical protein HOLleu_02437 [Holothuria leucospilota]
MQGILNDKRQFRMVLKMDIPSFLFIGGSKAHIRYFAQPRTRCGRCRQVRHNKAECPNDMRYNLCGEEGHLSGACLESYSVHASADVGQAPEPSQTDPEYFTQELEEAVHEEEQDFLASKQCEGVLELMRHTPTILTTAPGEAGNMTVDEDLQLSSDTESSASAMSDDGEPVPESPRKDPLSGEGRFDLCEGAESTLKRPAWRGVRPGVHHSGTPAPSPRSKRVKSQADVYVMYITM